MQRNLLIKTLVIIGVLLIFVYGIFGIPGKLTGDGLRQAVLDRIHLGLDLRGGMHLILQVMVDEAVNTETDSAIGQLKEEMQKQGIAFTDMSKPDPAHPETFAIAGVPALQLHGVPFRGQCFCASSQRARDLDLVPGVHVE